ncbi:MAG: tetratricopeptide repeat protein [Alphaproteobacteria bacterium]|nr:tetratricopeptide repeat protein [Alphaproteobacteria bacterium]
MNDPRHARPHVEDAIRLLDEGQIRGALAALDQAFAAEGTDVTPWDYVPGPSQGAPWSRAVEALQAAVAEHDETGVRLALAHAYARAGCPADGAVAYTGVRTHRAAAVEGAIGLGRARLALGEDAEALAAFDDALKVLPESLDALAGRATALDRLGRAKEAVTAWRTLASLAPEHPGARRRIRGGAPVGRLPLPASGPHARALCWAMALFRDGRYDEAEEVLSARAELREVPVEIHIALGRVRHAAGHLATAREALELALPRRAAARTRLALAHALRLIGHPAARKTYDEVRDDGNADPFVLAGYADGVTRLGDPEAALAAADLALDLDAYAPFARVVRARALAALSSRPEGTKELAEAARDAWRKVLEVRPGDPEAVRGVDGVAGGEPGRTERGVARIHFDLGRSMVQRGRYREAVHAFRNATEIRSDWNEPWRALGQAYLALDDRPAAVEAFRGALDRDPADLESATHLGDLLRGQGALPAALGAYEQALNHDATFVGARLGRGEVRRMSGAFDDAIADYEAVLKGLPDDPTALIGLAAALNGLHRFAEARSAWTRAREQDPQSTFVAKGLAQCHAGLRGNAPLPFEDISREAQPPRSEGWAEHDETYDRYEAMDHVDRGRSYHKERNFAAAIDAFKKALEIDPTCDEAALRLGMAYEDDRQFRRAIAAYRTCLEIEPNHYQAATNIGEAYRKNEQYREAIGAYDQALAMKPDYLYALAGRAECMRMLGRYEDCLGWFDKALAVGTNHAFAIQGKAAALNALQRFDDAVVYWNHALEIEPQSQFALDGKAYCEAQLRRIDAERGEDDEPASTSESSTPTLDEQGRDLTALARAGKLPKVIGRDREIRQVMKTLVRRLKANPLLLGEPGVGKTAVVEGLAHRLVHGQAPERLKDLRIIELSMGTLIAGTKYRGTFEERLREIVKEATSVPGLVLFIDEIHTLVGAGRTEGGSLDAANILKPALARGEITVIGATTLAEYRQHFETDSALERRFQPIQIDEPSPEACIQLLGAVAGAYEKHHGVVVEASALEACVHMAVRFLPDRRLPDKALDMLDEACAEASLAEERVVDGEIVARVISERTGVPVQKLTEAERERMDAMEGFLEERVHGQDEAVTRLAEAVRLAKAGLRAGTRPRAVFLFRGPSGVGKTELAKALADFLFPEGDALIRLDMSEYADRFTTTRLLGAPPGYSGHGEEGQLTGPLRRKPYSVVLLDEFEKAHPDVQAMFLTLLDEGMVTDADGRSINAREAFFILTTNAGAEIRGKGRLGFSSSPADAHEIALDAIRPYFRPELLDRIDEVIHFRELDDEALRAIASTRVGELVDRARVHGVTVRWRKDLLDHVIDSRRSGDRGARQILRAVDLLIGEPLGRVLLRHVDDVARTVRLSVRDGKVQVDEIQPEPQPAQPRA